MRRAEVQRRGDDPGTPRTSLDRGLSPGSGRSSSPFGYMAGRLIASKDDSGPKGHLALQRSTEPWLFQQARNLEPSGVKGCWESWAPLHRRNPSGSRAGARFVAAACQCTLQSVRILVGLGVRGALPRDVRRCVEGCPPSWCRYPRPLVEARERTISLERPTRLMRRPVLVYLDSTCLDLRERLARWR